MASETNKGFFNKKNNRMLVTLLLGVGYPIVCAAMFPIFMFLILPVTPLVSVAALSLYVYWLVSAGVWLASLGIVLPQMRSEIPVEHGLLADPDSNFDLQRIRSRGSCDDFLDDAKDDDVKKNISKEDLSNKEEDDEEEGNKRYSFGSSDECRYQLVPSSSQPKEPSSKERSSSSEGTATPPRTGILEQRKAVEVEVEVEPGERKSLLEPDVVDEETVVATKTTTSSKCAETSVTTTTTVRETYECSLPSPEPTSPGGDRTKNTVFIFVNNDPVQKTEE